MGAVAAQRESGDVRIASWKRRRFNGRGLDPTGGTHTTRRNCDTERSREDQARRDSERRRTRLALARWGDVVSGLIQMAIAAEPMQRTVKARQQAAAQCADDRNVCDSSLRDWRNVLAEALLKGHRRIEITDAQHTTLYSKSERDCENKSLVELRADPKVVARRMKLDETTARVNDMEIQAETSNDALLEHGHEMRVEGV